MGKVRFTEALSGSVLCDVARWNHVELAEKVLASEGVNVNARNPSDMR